MLVLSLKGYSKEQLKEMALIEVAHELLNERKEPLAFADIVSELKNLLDLSEKEFQEKIAQFYTDLNIEGHFIGLGDNRWGLRAWYPVEQYEEEVVTVIKPKKKKAKKSVIDEEEEDFEEEDIDYDDLEDYDDLDEDDNVDDLLDDEDDDDEDIEEDFDEDDELIDDLEDDDLDEDEDDEDRK